MPRTEQQCFDIAIRIVKQHDKDDLLTIFQAILKESFLSCHVTLNNMTSDDFIVSSEKHRSLLDECILNRKPLFSFEEKFSILPIVSLGKVTSFISIDGKLTNDDTVFINQLMVLFSNQLLLLDNNNHDTLTGLLNRHSFEDRIANIVDSQPRRNNENKPHYCFAILDIDFFKRVNDDFGHLYGDEVLILFTNIMEATFRHDDMLFRYGGEEFSVLLRDIDLNTATDVLNRFREKVEHYSFPQVGCITVSIGVTELTAGLSRIEIISRADQALYYSKENGRNQVNNFEALIAEEKLIDNTPNINDIELF